MPGRHEPAVRTGRDRRRPAGRGRRWLTGALGLTLAGLLVTLTLVGPADAASRTIRSQLSLSGLASADSPLGGSKLGLHPGDRVSFTAAGAPTAGLHKLGLGGLVDGVLSLGATFQVRADFSQLPGGHKNTVLGGRKAATFRFPTKGTYSFTWTAQKVTLLGVVPIDLDGNQLKGAGVKLNASNAYFGQIVVAKNPPGGGLTLQLPGVGVAPSAPVVGQQPTLSIPGATLPTVSTSVPDLDPSTTAPKPPSGGGQATATRAPSDPSYTLPPLVRSVPDLVVPHGDGDAVYPGSGGGFQLGVLPDTGTGGGGGSGRLSLNPDAVATAAGGHAPLTVGQDSTGQHRTIELASSDASPSGQLPVLLAILAVIALAMVAGTYARIYLLGPKKT